MFILHADKNQMTVREKEPVTSGSVQAYTVRFEFSPDWDGLTRTAVFRAGAESRSVLLDDTNTCKVPWETLEKPGVLLQAGVYGTRGGEEVLPTVWSDLGNVSQGVMLGEDAHPPTPDLYQKIMEAVQKAVETAQSVRDDADSGIFTGPEGPSGPQGEQGLAGEGVPVGGEVGQVLTKTEDGAEWADPTGGGGGSMDHQKLYNRDAENQHPIKAIEGLEKALENVPRLMTADELQKILMN